MGQTSQSFFKMLPCLIQISLTFRNESPTPRQERLRQVNELALLRVFDCGPGRDEVMLPKSEAKSQVHKQGRMDTADVQGLAVKRNGAVEILRGVVNPREETEVKPLWPCSADGFLGKQRNRLSQFPRASQGFRFLPCQFR